MNTTISNLDIPRSQVVRALMHIRYEWEDAARGDSLLEITGNVGLLLLDIADALGLQGSDLQLALGDLVQEYAEFEDS